MEYRLNASTWTRKHAAPWHPRHCDGGALKVIWLATMFLDDWPMLQCQMEALEGVDQVVNVAVESPRTHRGDPKPLHLQENPRRWAAARVSYCPRVATCRRVSARASAAMARA